MPTLKNTDPGSRIFPVIFFEILSNFWIQNDIPFFFFSFFHQCFLYAWWFLFLLGDSCCSFTCSPCFHRCLFLKQLPHLIEGLFGQWRWETNLVGSCGGCRLQTGVLQSACGLQNGSKLAGSLDLVIVEQWDFQGPPMERGPLFPYYSHTTPIRIPEDMGIVWEAYHKGVQLLGVLGITLDSWQYFLMLFYHGILRDFCSAWMFFLFWWFFHGFSTMKKTRWWNFK